MLFWHWVRFFLFSHLNYQWQIYKKIIFKSCIVFVFKLKDLADSSRGMNYFSAKDIKIHLLGRPVLEGFCGDKRYCVRVKKVE